VDGQTNVAIHVVQGERELAEDCRSLARFDLKGIPPMTAGLPRIEVKFLIDADGILRVNAREQRSGKEAQIEVKPTYGLTDEQVETMILDSFDHAEEDFAKRLLIEARNEAESLLTKVEQAKNNPVWAQLTGEEQAAISAAQDKLASAKLGTDASALREATATLDRSTQRLAELMMDAAVTSAIRGKTMQDAGEDLDDSTISAPHPFAPTEFR
jgi:molecular chaperone DnaK (HSP70)